MKNMGYSFFADFTWGIMREISNNNYILKGGNIMLIKDCGLTVRTSNALRRHGIETVGDLYEKTDRYGRDYLVKVVRDLGKGGIDDLMTNDITKYVMNHCEKKFNKRLYENDIKEQEFKRKEETIEFKRREIERLMKEIQELEES